MLVLQAFVTLGVLIALGESTLTFINPSPGGENSDYSADPTYKEGETVTLAWSGSETGVPLTLVMFQQIIDGEGDANDEVIIPESISGLSSYVWTVSTEKNLTASNVFFLELYSNQSTSPDSSSHYFNITSDDDTSTTSSASISTTATTTSASATSAIGAVTSSSVVPSATSSAAVSSGLSSDAKIGIGVGIAVPVSLAIGALLGWCFYKRRIKAKGASTAATEAAAKGDYASNASTRTPSHLGMQPMPFSGAGSPQHGESQHGYNNQQIPELYEGQQIPTYSNSPHHPPVQLDGEETARQRPRYEML